MSARRTAPADRAERLAALRLYRSENVGPATYHALLERFGTPAAALEAVPGLARRGGAKRAIRLASPTDAEKELARAEDLGARIVLAGEPGYPPLLAKIDSAPPLLTIRGHAHLADRPAIAIVGARNASALGRRLASDLARGLGEAGYTVVSGLARGIDTAAHTGALATGTLAVLAGGIDHVYPKENEALHRDIADTGLLLSEMPAGFSPQGQHFPRRNRLVSGIAHGVLIVEAALRSGSLITARLALDQGREVMAVPGSPLDPRARGANDLLRKGATLVETLDDILAAIEPQRDRLMREIDEPPAPDAPPARVDEATLDRVRGEVTDLLGPHPVAIDEITRQSGAPAAAVLTILLELELAGRLMRHPGGKVALDPAG